MSNAVNTESAPPAKTDQLGHVEPKIEKHGHDVDEAMRAFEALQGETIELDEATNRRLLRTVDWHIMPIMCFVYGMNYLDKTALSYASVMGLEEDLSLHGNQYQWLGSLFYIGSAASICYLAWEYPTSRLLQWLPLGKYSAACIVIWGLVLACFAAVVNYPGAVAIRLFLGIFEAAVTPGFTLLTSQWYTKYEQYSRVNIWFSFNGVGQIVGGLVAYGIAVGSEKNGSAIAPWKVLFLVTGVLTMVLGLIFLVIVPDSQLNAWWLKKEDRALAVARVRVNQQGIGNKHFKLYQVKEALLDPMTWAFFLYALVSDIPNGGLTNFFSQLIRNFGFTSQQSLLYGVPGGAVEVISLLASGYVGHITRECLMSSLGGQVAAIVGMVLIVALPLSDNTGRLIGYYMTQANATGFVALLSLISSNVAGYTKKTTVAALYLIGYCAGNIVGPQIFLPKDAPRYVPAEITIIVCWAVCCLLLVAIRFWYRRENKRKAVLRADPGYIRLENQEWLDLTDRENLDFVYSL